MRAKNWKVTDKVSLYTQWTNNITGSEVEIRKNLNCLWDITIIKGKGKPHFYKIKHIAEDCTSRDIASQKAIIWMQKHPVL